jgi:membrane protein YdbS with pleckstrin-like domain
METGWDPKATRMFKKIMNSVSFTLLWMLAMATAGFYFELAVVEETVTVKNIIFFSLFVISLFLLIRYLYKTWRHDF